MTGFNRPNQNCNRMEAKQDEDGNSSKGASPSRSRSRSNGSTSPWDEESMVGFQEEALMIKEQLAGSGGPKQLEVISIVGMAGLGKTTLATNLYRDSLIEYHFPIRAWISVSQVYNKRDLLITMVTSVVPHISGIDQMSIEKLSDELYKGLKGRRYLIVVDDVWESSAWDDLKFHFPNDTNGSRIMLTSRREEVALHAKRSYPHLSLRFLDKDESWDLFKKKVFWRETFPPELMEIGKNIVAKCQGLPLAIVVVAGVLANEEKNRYRWRQVGKAMNPPMVANQQLWMTLTLSYSHLPNHLKLCFLYFGAFPEDFQVPVWKLIWLWIAEGFVQKTEGKCLEDVAEGYLLDLIGRSLILVSTRRYDGEIKACGIHDLLREFCLKKAEEDYFLLQISCNQHLSSRPSTLFSRMRLLSIYGSVKLWDVISKITSAASTSSVLCFGRRATPWNSEIFPPTFSPKWFNLLGVFDMSSGGITRYPTEIEQFVRLKYLSLCIYSVKSKNYLPESISNLSNLETLILCTLILLPCVRQELHEFLVKSSSFTLPHCVRNMVKLRHIRLTGHGIHRIEGQDYLPFLLDNLQTLSWVNPTSCQAFLVGTPNIRKLGFRGPLISGRCLSFPHLDNLTNLQELKLFNTGSKEIVWLSYNLGRVKFPPNLKKLTLKETYLKWEEMSTLGNLLPNLESLKLLAHACTGEHWETSDGDFPQLKFLKLESLGIVRWKFSSSHFPRLQRLEVSHCYWLEKIQSEIVDIPTLQMMTVHCCNLSLADSAREIKEEQQSNGNKWFQFTESNNIAMPEMLEVSKKREEAESAVKKFIGTDDYIHKHSEDSDEMEHRSFASESDSIIEFEMNNNIITWRQTLPPNPQRGRCICFRTADLDTGKSVTTRFYSVPSDIFGGGDNDVSSPNPDVEGLESFYKCTDFSTTSTLSSVGSSLFVVGGSKETGPCRVSITTEKMYQFDTTAPENGWYGYELSMCTPRAFPITVAMDGKLYIFGGSGPESSDAPLAEMFNPESSKCESLPRPPSFHIDGWRHLVVAALQPYKKILVASGLSDVVSVYNVVKGVWEELDHKVDFSSVRGQAAVVQNGNALCWCSNNVEEVHAYHLVHKRWFKSPIKGLDKVGMRYLDEPTHDCLILPLDDNHLCLLWKDHMGYDRTNLPLLHCIKIQVSIDLGGSRFDAAVVASRNYALGPDESIFDAHVFLGDHDHGGRTWERSGYGDGRQTVLSIAPFKICFNCWRTGHTESGCNQVESASARGLVPRPSKKIWQTSYGNPFSCFNNWWQKPENQLDFWRISGRGVAVSLGETPRYIFSQILQLLKRYHDRNVGYGYLLDGVRIDENNQVVLEAPNPDIPLPLAEPFAAIKQDFLDFEKLFTWVEGLIDKVTGDEPAYSSSKFHELCRLLDKDNHYRTVDELRCFGFYMRNNPLFWDEAAKFLFFRKVLTIKEFDVVAFRKNVNLFDIRGWSQNIRNASLLAVRDHNQNENHLKYCHPDGSIVFYGNCLGQMRGQKFADRYDDAKILLALEDDLPKVIPVWFNALVYLDLDPVRCRAMCGSGWMEFLSKQPSVFT